MTRPGAALLSLLLSVPALGELADLRLTIDVARTVRLGDVLTLTATIENRGPDPARNTRAAMRIIPGLQCDVINMPLGDLAPGERRVVSCSQEVLDYGLYYLRSGASVFSETPEPHQLQGDNFAQAFTDRITEGTQLGVSLYRYPAAARPGLPFDFTVTYANWSRTPATNATLTFTLSDGSFGEVPPSCTVEGSRAVCRLGTVHPPVDPERHPNVLFTIPIVAPDRSDVAFDVRVELAADQADERPADNTREAAIRTHRTFYVTEASDAAFRGALLAAGAACDGPPCLVAFRIPNGAGKWHTVRLESELDWVRGTSLEIDGTTQTGYFGDTNPDGPEIEIDGSRLTAGDGLRIPAHCGMTVRGLTINGFPGSGILLHDTVHACKPSDLPQTVIESNYIGTDPTGTRAVPNERGIFSASATTWQIRQNVVSGNRRSGVFVDRGRGNIFRNIIGLNRTHDAPLPNGASGVYVAAQGSGTDVNDNYIGFNAHFGVGIDRRADRVAVNGNSFQANGGLAIDWGLDGPERAGRVPAPRIRSATYANGVTTIEVDTSNAGGTFPFVNVYASDAPDPSGYGEGQYFLGAVRHPYRIEVPQDLRGKWISATLTEVVYLGFVRTNGDTRDFHSTTSEFSRAVEVSPAQ